jgi:hypothetical protein
MKNTPFILLLLGVSFIWLGLTGRLGAVLAAIFEPKSLTQTTGGGGGSIAPVVLPDTPIGGGEPTPSTPEELPAEPPTVEPPASFEPPVDIFGDMPIAV